jgi:hypothetical protein
VLWTFLLLRSYAAYIILLLAMSYLSSKWSTQFKSIDSEMVVDLPSNITFNLTLCQLSILLATTTKISSAEVAHVREIRASNSTVWYGGEKIGNLAVGFTSQGYEPTSGGLVNLTAHVALFPASGSVLEGWLIDPDIPLTLI